MNKSLLALFFIIALLFVPINYNSKDSSKPAEAPRLNKTIKYFGGIKIEDFAGNVTIYVKISKIEIDGMNVKTYCSYKYTLRGYFEHNLTYYEKTFSGSGVRGAIAYVKVGLPSPYDYYFLVPVAIVPDFAPAILSKYWTYEYNQTSEHGYNKTIVDVFPSDRLGLPAVLVFIYKSRNNESYWVNEVFEYSIPFGFIDTYIYTVKGGNYIISVEAKEFIGVEPFEGSEIKPPIYNATRTISGTIYRGGELIGIVSGKIFVDIDKCYRYGDTYRFTTFRYGYLNYTYIYGDHNETRVYNIVGPGVFGYSSYIPLSPIGNVSFIIDTENLEESVSKLENLGFNIEYSDTEITIGGKSYKGYSMKISSQELLIDAQVLKTGVAANMKVKYTEGGKEYELNITMIEVYIPSNLETLYLIIIIAVLVVSGRLTFSKKEKRFLDSSATTRLLVQNRPLILS